MKQEEYIIKKYRKDSGMKVPVNYFPDLENKIMDSLPPYNLQQREPVLTRWQRVKPYIYLAAMFCGIWLMMKLFHTVSQPMTIGLDNPPEVLVQWMDHDNYDYDVMTLSQISDYGLEYDIVMDYDSFEEFEKDFISNE